MNESYLPDAGRVPPHSTDAEQALLGCLLYQPALIDDIVDTVIPNDFYHRGNGDVLTAILALYGRSEPVDAVSVNTELRRTGVTEEDVPRHALLDMQAAAPIGSNAPKYAAIIADAAANRRLIEAGRRVIEHGFSGVPAVEAIAHSEQALIDLGEATQPNTAHRELSDIAAGVLASIAERVQNPGARIGVTTGLKSLDNLLGGLRPGGLYVLAAGTGVGKTAMALHIAAAVLKTDKAAALMFSLEMSAEELYERLLVAETSIPTMAMQTGEFSTGFEDLVHQASAKIQEWPLDIRDSPRITAPEIRAACRRAVAQRGSLGIVVVDYLQLMGTTGDVRERHLAVAEISRALKSIAREFEVPVLALAQLNRQANTRASKVPILSDIRESASIEQDANVVMFLHRGDMADEADRNSGEAQIIVAKNRSGPTGTLTVQFQPAIAKFGELVHLQAF